MIINLNYFTTKFTNLFFNWFAFYCIFEFTKWCISWCAIGFILIYVKNHTFKAVSNSSYFLYIPFIWLSNFCSWGMYSITYNKGINASYYKHTLFKLFSNIINLLSSLRSLWSEFCLDIEIYIKVFDIFKILTNIN